MDDFERRFRELQEKARRSKSPSARAPDEPKKLSVGLMITPLRKRKRCPKGFHWVSVSVEALDAVRESVRAGYQQLGDMVMNLLARIPQPWAHDTSFDVEASVVELAKELHCDRRKVGDLASVLETTRVCIVVRRPGKPLRFRFVWGAKGFLNPDLMRPDARRLNDDQAPKRRKRGGTSKRQPPGPPSGDGHHVRSPMKNSASQEQPRPKDGAPRARARVEGESSQYPVLVGHTAASMPVAPSTSSEATEHEGDAGSVAALDAAVRSPRAESSTRTAGQPGADEGTLGGDATHGLGPYASPANDDVPAAVEVFAHFPDGDSSKSEKDSMNGVTAGTDNVDWVSFLLGSELVVSPTSSPGFCEADVRVGSGREVPRRPRLRLRRK